MEPQQCWPHKNICACALHSFFRITVPHCIATLDNHQQCWKLLRSFANYVCMHHAASANNSQQCWPNNVASVCLGLCGARKLRDWNDRLCHQINDRSSFSVSQCFISCYSSYCIVAVTTQALSAFSHSGLFSISVFYLSRGSHTRKGALVSIPTWKIIISRQDRLII